MILKKPSTTSVSINSIKVPLVVLSIYVVNKEGHPEQQIGSSNSKTPLQVSAIVGWLMSSQWVYKLAVGTQSLTQ